jgi:predicted acylesterase/phospholipase RssA
MQSLERLQRARKIGFLFAGGASRCIFQVGVLETLFELGIEPSICLGVSGGAWNAAAVAVGNWRRLRARLSAGAGAPGRAAGERRAGGGAGGDGAP